jgi:hypothetical protein
MKIEFHYRAKGHVEGNSWGGGKVSYPANNVSAATKEDLHRKINEGIENGSLDSGFGFENLTGAVMEITTIRMVEIEGRTYYNEEIEMVAFGKIEPENFDYYNTIMNV